MLRFGTISEARREAQEAVIRAAFSGDGHALDQAIEQLRAVDEAETRARRAAFRGWQRAGRLLTGRAR